MSALDDLFNSPPWRPPHATPPPPGRADHAADPLFFSPGASSSLGGSPSPRPPPALPSPPSQHAQPKTGASGLVRIRHSNLDGGASAGGNGFAGGGGLGGYVGYGGYGEGGGGGVGGERVGGAGGEEEEEEGGKRKRVMAKVDADRLLGPRGLPALCRAAKKFKVHGKGREKEDLRNVLNMYQMWAHGMFPKGDFAHTMARVEVVCRSRRMESALKGCYEAMHTAVPSVPAEEHSAVDWLPASDAGGAGGLYD